MLLFLRKESPYSRTLEKLAKNSNKQIRIVYLNSGVDVSNTNIKTLPSLLLRNSKIISGFSDVYAFLNRVEVFTSELIRRKTNER